MKTTPKYLLAAALFVALMATFSASHAQEHPPRWSWLPDQTFLQVGVAEDASAVTAGAIWTSDWSRLFKGGLLSAYWEVSFGRWSAEQEDGSTRTSWVTQLGVTPVLRWQFGNGEPRWFVEGGIGANFLLPIYKSREKRFSTTFNFGDHLGVGLLFGEANRHELALRVQHFSNGGMKRPNPGEDFLQLRYSVRY